MKQLEKKTFFRKNSRFKRNIQLFSLLFCLPIIIIAVMIRLFVIGNIQQTLVTKHGQDVGHQVAYVNNQINQLELLGTGWGYSLQQNRDFTDFSVQDFIEIKDLSQKLFFIQNSNVLIKSAQLAFFTEEPFMIKEGGTWQVNEITDFSYYQIANNKEFQWRTSKKGELLFIQRLNQVDAKDDIYFSMTIDQSALKDLLKIINISDSGSAAMVIDNQEVASFGDPIPDKYLEKEIFKQTNQEYDKKGIRYNLISSTTSRLSQDWTFYSVVPISSITEPIKSLSNILIVISTALLVFTYLLTRWFAKVQYRPVEETMTMLFGSDEWKNQNEFDYIQSKWQQIMETQMTLESDSKRNKKRVKQSVVSQVVKGQNSHLLEDELVALMQRNGLKIKNEQFRLLLIQLTDYLPDRHFKENESSSIANFILENVTTDLSDDYFKEFAIVSYLENGICVFVAEKTLNDWQKFSENVSQQINVLTGRFVTTIVSDETAELKQLPNDYHNLLHHSDYQLMELSNQILTLSELTNHIPSRQLYPDYLEKRIMDAIKMTHPNDLLKSTELFVKTLLKEKNQQSYLLEGIKQLYDEINFFMGEINVSSTKYMTKDNLIKELKVFLDSEQVVKTLFDLFLEPILILYKEQADNNHVEVVRQIVDYLNTNYQDTNISLEQQAEDNGLEVTFLSREFKKLVGLNFVDYLTNLRLEKAKKLLISTSKKINDIAEEVGYNSSYFNRLFKKKFDVTPGQYRKEHSQD